MEFIKESLLFIFCMIIAGFIWYNAHKFINYHFVNQHSVIQRIEQLENKIEILENHIDIQQ